MTAQPFPTCHQPYICIEFSPTSGCLGSIMTMVAEFCRGVVDEPNLTFAFQLAAYELTENLVKYSLGDGTKLQVSVASGPSGTELSLETENEATDERLLDVVARLETDERATNAAEYLEQLAQNTAFAPGTTGFGLGRLRTFGELRVSHQVDARRIQIQVRSAIVGSVPSRNSAANVSF